MIHVRWLPASLMLAAAVLALACAGRLNAYWMHVAIIAMYYAILASSWSLLAGYAGLFSLSHMAFASIGGYTSGMLTQWLHVPIPFGLLAGVIVCCAGGGAIGWVCLRMSGPYLAIFTLGFSEIVRITIATEDDVTAGMAGLHTEPLFASATRLPYFYVAFALLAASLLLMSLLVRSRWGLFLRAIREDEQAATASGVAVERCRIVAFAIASGFAGLAGGFYAHYIGIMTPGVGDLDEMAKLVVMTVIGGMERLPTAVGGAFVVQFLLEWLREYGQWRLPVFGIVLLLTMRLARNGLLTPLWLPFLRLGEARGQPLVAAPTVPHKEPGT
ncbi:MAG: branched-chain amino acid ABC transporter permease [Candidatus Rokuibacteriota bacterium]|nr:MAG: branched-chain amino acid ABC transporter permease [Candidatus Rokubacteria bacterium]